MVTTEAAPVPEIWKKKNPQKQRVISHVCFEHWSYICKNKNPE